LFVSPDSQLKYIKPGVSGFDVDLLRIAMEEITPHSVVWDIGANVGVFSIAAAARAVDGEVLAIEPDRWLGDIIRRSIGLVEKRRLKVEVLEAAVSDQLGTAMLLIAKRGRASNALESVRGRAEMGGVRDRVLVPTVTIDSLLARRATPHLVKIDVEGAELQVLKGSAKLLAGVRPRIYIEVGDDVADEVTKLLHESAYVLLDPLSPKSTRRRLQRCAFNTLAIPAEQA